MPGRFSVVACLSFVAVGCAQAAWHEVVTPNFVLRTDLDRAAALRAGQALESTRDALLSAAWPHVELPAIDRTEVYVLADPRDVEGAFGPGVGAWFLGGYHPAFVLGGPPEHWEVRRSLQVEATSTLRYGMAFSFVVLIYPTAPGWFRIGLSQFLETVHLSESGREVMLGAVNVEALSRYRRVRTVSVARVLEWDGQATSSQAEQSGLMGASWLLVHWLFNARAEPFARYQTELGRGTDSAQAWKVGFPAFDPAEADRELFRYASHGTYTEASVPFRSGNPRITERLLAPADGHVARAEIARLAAAKTEAGELAPAARAEVEKALQIDPVNVRALELAAWLPAEERLRRARQATSTHPDDPEVWTFLMTELPETAETGAERENACRRALALAPDKPLYLNNLAWVLTERGKLAEAIPLAMRANKLVPRHAAFLDTYAAALFRAGLCQKGLDVQRQIMPLLPPGSSNLRTLSEKRLGELEAKCGGEKRPPKQLRTGR